MDKKKILILIFLLFFFTGKSFGNSITYNFSNKETIYRDSHGDLFNLNIDSLKNIKGFSYYLIKHEENKILQRTIDNKSRKKIINKIQIPNDQMLSIDLSKSILITLKEDNKEENLKLLSEFSESFNKVEIYQNNITEKIDPKNLKKKDYKYFINKQKKDYVTEWHFADTETHTVIQKIFNKSVKSSNLLIIFELTNGSLPEKINIRFTVKTNDNKNLEGLSSTHFLPNIIELESGKFIAYATISLFNDQSLINSYKNIIIKEKIFHYDKKNFNVASPTRYELLEIKDVNEYLIQFDNKYLFIHNLYYRLFYKKNFIINNTKAIKSVTYYTNNTYYHQPIYMMQKSEWSGDLYTLIEFLSNNNENKYLYVDDIKSNSIKINEYSNYLKQIINYIIITPLCIGLIIYILTRNFKSRIEKYLDLLFGFFYIGMIVAFDKLGQLRLFLSTKSFGCLYLGIGSRRFAR